MTPDARDFNDAQTASSLGEDATPRATPRTNLISALLDNVVEAVIAIDEQGSIESFNRAAERIFGYAAAEVIGKNVKVLMPQPHRDQHDHYIENHRQTGIKKIIGIGREVEGQRKDGSLFPLHLAVSEFYLDSERMYIGLLRDLTESKRAQEKLLSEHHFNQAVLDQVREGISVYDRDLRLIAWNQFMEELTGRKYEDVAGAHLYDIYPSLRAHEAHLSIQRALAGETLSSAEPLGRIRGTTTFLAPGLRADEVDNPSAAWTQTTWAPYRDQSGNITAAIVTVADVTDLLRRRDRSMRQAEQLRQLSSHLEGSREAERMRIAHELHDELAGLLTAIKLDLNRMTQSKTGDTARIESLLELTNAAVKSTRRIINDLRPPALDQLGLWSALEWLGNDVANRTGLTVETDIAPDLESLALTPAASISIYRIVQEALNNAVRHAEASLLRIRAWRRNDELFLQVIDNGKGIDDKARSKQGHWGLIGMNERAISHGGNLSIDSTVGHGTTVQLQLLITGDSRA